MQIEGLQMQILYKKKKASLAEKKPEINILWAGLHFLQEFA